MSVMCIEVASESGHVGTILEFECVYLDQHEQLGMNYDLGVKENDVDCFAKNLEVQLLRMNPETSSRCFAAGMECILVESSAKRTDEKN